MLYEGIKETENTRIEKDEETKEEINMLYSFDVVLFEHSIIEANNLSYSICYFCPHKIYDVVIEDKVNSKLLKYESLKQLNEKYSKLFNLIKNEKYIDENGNEFKCMSHSIEYTL